MIHKAWCGIEEVPYYFSRSYIKFQGHTGWKIDDLDQICARLLGRSQLSNLSDLPCLRSSIKFLGHMGWKISDLNKVWIRLLGWSQLSIPSDLPCLFSCKMIKQKQLENHLVLLCHFCEAPFLLVKHTVTWITWNWHSYCCWFHC